MAHGSATVVKVVLCIFNFLFLLSGLLLITVGTVTHKKAKEFFNFTDGPGDSSAAALLIVAGVLIFLLAFFGFFGAVCENYFMLMTFSVLLFIIFVIEIACGILVYLQQSELKDRLTNGMKENFELYYSDAAPEVKIAWNKMQSKLKCCGINGSVDYEDKKWEIPESCCQQIPHPDIACQLYETGCVQTMFDLLYNNMNVIGGVGVCIGLVQIVGLVLACCLAKSVKTKYTRIS